MLGFAGTSASRVSACNSGDPGSIPGLGRYAGEEIGYPLQYSWFSLVASMIKKSTCSAGDLDSIPGLGRYPGGGHGNPLQYSCLENPVDRGAWRATVYGVTESWTPLSEGLSTFAHVRGKRSGCSEWWNNTVHCNSGYATLYYTFVKSHGTRWHREWALK